ncbi:MAG: DUF4149 domain-containing protein [Planctomycetes bacterium]|nr:DUF4149 domain-containing protein [Planctomycetota bacterium]
MKGARIIHAFTDVCLGLLVGSSVAASVAAATIFGVSREQGFPKHIANTLAGSMFDRLGWPLLIAALVATVGCIYAAKRPPLTGLATGGTRLAWKLMAVAAGLMLCGACLTQFYFAPRMADLRENSTWVNGELADPAEKAEFGRSHGLSMGVSGLATLIAAGLIVSRRLFTGAPGDQMKTKSGLTA